MGAVLAALLYGDDWLGRVDVAGVVLPAGVLMVAAFVVLIVLASRELCDVFDAKGVVVSRAVIAFGAAAGCVVMWVIPGGLDAGVAMVGVVTVLAAVVFISMYIHTRGGRTQGAVGAASATVFSFAYLGLLPGCYLAMRQLHSPWVIAGVIGVAKACDVCAYFGGRAFGRHKLIAWLSPGKTWEGLVAGVAGSAVLAVGLVAGANSYQATCGLWIAGVGGAVIALVGQLGDLGVSLLKRDAGVKDAGASVPGFGGLLDVFDSPILVAPVAYWLLMVAFRVG